MFRTFKVGSEKQKGVLVAFFVTDAIDNTELDKRPKAAEFTISELYDEITQEHRANDYRNYLNKLAEAAKQAYENNKLIDILKS